MEIEHGETSTVLRNCYGSDPYAVTPCTQQRSRASNLLTVRFEGSGQSVSYDIVSLSPQCSFYVNDISYSNDGNADRISVYLDGSKIGEFLTFSRSNYGRLWNTIRRSGPVGSAQTLSPGQHRLTFTVSSTDRYGVELDKVNISFTQCNGPCPAVISSIQSSIYENCNSYINFQSENGVSLSPLRLCDSVNSRTPCTQQRSEASNQRTIYLSSNGQNVSHRLTTTSWCAFRITNVRYSNDGPSDIIALLPGQQQRRPI